MAVKMSNPINLLDEKMGRRDVNRKYVSLDTFLQKVGG